MKKIGKEVLFLNTDEFMPRKGEGTFAKLKNGDILFAYTEYYGEGYADDCRARLSACISSDDGETWQEPKILLEKDKKAKNYMSPSLFRLADGGLGMVFLRKEMIDGQITCMPEFTRSDDEGITWSEYAPCTDRLGYYCAVNDSVCVRRDGSLLVPTSYYSSDPSKTAGVVSILCSRDNGKSWSCLTDDIKSPYGDLTGLQEPGIYEYEDKSLWLWCRTAYGFQYEAHSYDDGKTFTPMIPNFKFSSPDSPMRVKRVGKYTVAVFNPIGYTVVQSKGWKVSPDRTPLVCAVSEDDGKSFGSENKTFTACGFADFGDNCYLIEDDRMFNYCYPGILPVKDGFLVTYYHSNGSEICLNCTRTVKISYDEIEK